MPKAISSTTPTRPQPYWRSSASPATSPPNFDIKPAIPLSQPDITVPGSLTEIKPIPQTTPTSAAKKKKPTTTTSSSAPKPKSSSPGKNQAWSGSELLAVFHHVLAGGAPGSDSGWEGVVPGRTGNSIRLAWRKRVKPMIEAHLLGQGK